MVQKSHKHDKRHNFTKEFLPNEKFPSFKWNFGTFYYTGIFFY